MSKPVNSGRKNPDVEVKKADEESDNYDVWFRNVYDVSLMTNDDLNLFYDTVKYQGFDRTHVLHQLFDLIKNPKLVAQIVIMIALRGPKVASKMKLSNGTTLVQMGIPASGGKGSNNLTCNRIQAATADLAAFYLKRLPIPKRIASDLPAWLQFPSAGSIKLPQKLRDQHIDFQKQFSQLIGGVFNEQIYNQMVINAYLDVSLRLFEPP
jgi:hypothetical protein